MPAGIGGSGYIMVGLESVNGTLIQPTACVAVPILSESLKYTETKYFSPQLRQQTIVSDVKQGYYHVEGDISMEVDPTFLPYFMHASRHNISGGAGEYVYTPSSAGSTSTAAAGNVQRTMSINVVRSGVGFGYAGCTMGSFEFMIEDGVLKCTMNVVGLSEATPATLGTPTWAAPNLFGADASQIFVATSAVAPTFGAASVDYNGFTFRADYAAEPQNRIRSDRSASYVSFGETTAEIETELDFIDKTEYTAFVNATQKAIKLESANGGATYAAGTTGVKIQANRFAYETYDLGLAGIGDLVMAGVTARSIGIAGGNAYAISVKTPTTIA